MRELSSMLPQGVRRLFRLPVTPQRALRDLDEEMRFHFAMRVAELRALGMTDREAEVEAARRFGDPDEFRAYAARRANRNARWRGSPTWNLSQILRVAVRQLCRSPGFAAPIILILALGIGLSIAVFTVADALLLRHLPVKDQGKLVVLWGEMRSVSFDHYPLGLDAAHEFARRTRRLDQVAFVGYEGAWPITLRDGDETFRLRRAIVSGTFFDVLGARPVLGRALRTSDDLSGAAPAVVLSYGAWQERFGGDPHVLGRRLVLYDNAVTYTVVGVMPRGLDYPRGAEVWLPIMPSVPAKSLQYVAIDVVGRVAPGATGDGARDELSAFFLRQGGPLSERDLRGVVHSLPRLVLGDTRPALLVFSAAVALLLLITCVNVANLLLVRGIARVREIAVRSALGAGRLRIAGQLVSENALLAIAGGALGVLVAAAAVRVLLAFASTELPRADEIGWNSTVLVAALTITGVAMLLFGLAPAIMTSRANLHEALRAGARQSGARSRRATEMLAIGQIALAMMVLSAAGVIAKSFINLERAPLSIDASHLLIGELALRYDQFDTRAKGLAVLDRLLPKLEAIPGVSAASPVVAIPFSGNGGWDGRMVAAGQSPTQIAANPLLNMEVVMPHYFAALGIPVLRGRTFTEADRENAPPVVILSQSAARHYWPKENPLGKRLKVEDTSSQKMTVVGIVPDTRYRDLRTARPSIYFPLRQPLFPYVPTALAIRTIGPPDHLIPTIRRVVAESEPGVALSNVAPFDDYLDKPLAQARLNALLLAVFGGSALLLAAAGLFGVMITMVRHRTRELGVRMALGASPAEVWQLVLRRGMVLAAAGTLVGLVGALATNRLLVSMLYEVGPIDATTLSLVAAVLLALGGLASLLPARSSSSIDPVVALRAE